tara:strand:+ start:588 stop:848 length:261 start_codon:yes stop_codon:yes gene_type:complete
MLPFDKLQKQNRDDFYLTTFALGQRSMEINKEVSLFIMDEFRSGEGDSDKLRDLISLAMLDLVKIAVSAGLSLEDIGSEVNKAAFH